MLIMVDGKVAEFNEQSTCSRFEAPQGRELSVAERQLSAREQVTDDQLLTEFNHSKRFSAVAASGLTALKQTMDY